MKSRNLVRPHWVFSFWSLRLFLFACFHPVNNIWLLVTYLLFKWPYIIYQLIDQISSSKFGKFHICCFLSVAANTINVSPGQPISELCKNYWLWHHLLVEMKTKVPPISENRNYNYSQTLTKQNCIHKCVHVLCWILSE